MFKPELQRMQQLLCMVINSVKLNQLKANNFEMKSYPVCLGNISKYFIYANMERSNLIGCMYDYNTMVLIIILLM